MLSPGDRFKSFERASRAFMRINHLCKNHLLLIHFTAYTNMYFTNIEQFRFSWLEMFYFTVQYINNKLSPNILYFQKYQLHII